MNLYETVMSQIKFDFMKANCEVNTVKELNNCDNEEFLSRISVGVEEVLWQYEDSIKNYIEAEIHKINLELYD